MKKIIIFFFVFGLILLAGCSNKNVLFKDDIYTITKGENGVEVSIREEAVVPTVHDVAKEYIDDRALPCLAVLSYEDNLLTVASYDYDGDAKDDFKLWKLTTTDNATFNSIMVIDKKGRASLTVEDIPPEAEKYIGDYYTCGYFEFNPNGEVTHVTFYGDTVIQ